MAATCATIAANIGQPTIWQEQGTSVPVQKEAIPEKTAATIASWLAGSFVVSTGTGASVVLEAVLSAGTTVYGFCPDAAFSAGATVPTPVPPTGLFGFNHYVFDPRDRVFSMNVADASASGATVGLNTGPNYIGDGTNPVALAPGQQYGIVRPTSGTYKDVQFVNNQNTTQKVVEIVGPDPRGKTTDANCRVLVKIIPTVIQVS